MEKTFQEEFFRIGSMTNLTWMIAMKLNVKWR